MSMGPITKTIKTEHFALSIEHFKEFRQERQYGREEGFIFQYP
jgi:hypothetical protein